MLHLPTPDSPLRETFDVDALAQMRRNDYPFYSQAVDGARRTMQKDRAIKSVHFIATSIVDGNIYLCRAGQRGGVAKLWKFGHITDVPL